MVLLRTYKYKACAKTCAIALVFLVMTSFILRKPTFDLEDIGCRQHTQYNGLVHVASEILDFFGALFNIHKEIPFSKFDYPSNTNIRRLVKDVNSGHSIEKYGAIKYSFESKEVIIPEPCYDPVLLIFVKSAVPNVAHRHIIRKTWGKSIKKLVQTYFLIGRNDNFKTNIEQEANQYNDIFQTDLNDNYSQNTYKVIHGLTWLKNWCPKAKYILLIDDDYIAFPRRIIDFLNSSSAYQKENLIFMGHSISQRRPHRSSLSKWRISFEEYPYDLFPKFLTAGSIILSQKCLYDMVIAMPYVKPLFNDDVYLGIVSHKLDIIPLDNKLMTLDKVLPQDRMFKHVLTSHGYHCTSDVSNAWEKYMLLLY